MTPWLNDLSGVSCGCDRATAAPAPQAYASIIASAARTAQAALSGFASDTLIATPKGERQLLDLKPGDRVITRDNGIHVIRWTGSVSLTGAQLKRAEHLRPVLIRRGALGRGLPERDVVVPPNQRILVANDKTALHFDGREVLAAAKHLTGLPGVDLVDASQATYLRILFDHHQIILSDGIWVECFHPDDRSLGGIGNAQRMELFELFPELAARAAPVLEARAVAP